jgi:hypothetical protein
VSADAFRRLALFSASSLYALGIILIAVWLNLWLASAVWVGGLCLALALTIEPTNKENQDLAQALRDRIP